MTSEEYKQYIIESRQQQKTNAKLPSSHKYGAIPTTVDDIRFDSKAEANRYQELKLLERGRKIRNLTLQPSFPIEVNGQKVCTYRADFSYIDDIGNYIVEDVKGMKTPVYNLKKKLMKVVLGIDILET